MLELKKVTKIYNEGTHSQVTALTNVSICFREHEFVSILGPSGCGKSTMLNIIGGLDRYTSGELSVDGVNTSEFTERDWDTYRNRKIGFVFQSYNLITHQTVLENVEIALTLSGVSALVRKRKAMFALEKVGLANHLHKKPNELSGGEMQRVAIARALVNDPEVILADEPTGALDSKTSVQIMDLLKEISKEKLVIMVTHNDALANEYSTRIIKLKDSKVISDSAVYDPKKEQKLPNKSINGKKDKEKEVSLGEKTENKKKYTSMSFWLSLSLSLKNLMTKKSRTALTSIASSIGIIGLALVLALFNGLNLFLDKIQNETLSAYPMYVSTSSSTDITEYVSILLDDSNYISNPNMKDKIFISHLITKLNSTTIRNKITPELQDYLRKMPEEYGKVVYTYGTGLKFYKKLVSYDISDMPEVSSLLNINEINLDYAEVSFSSSMFKEVVVDEDLILSQYEIVAGSQKLPSKPNELCLVLDKNNQITDTMLTALLIDINATKKNEDGTFVKDYYEYNDFLQQEKFNTFTVALNNGYYVDTDEDGVYEAQTWSAAKMLSSRYGISEDKIKSVLNANSIPLPTCYNGGTLQGQEVLDLKITCILRLKENVTTGVMGTASIGYTSALTEFLRDNANKSNVVKAQRAQLDNDSNTPYINVTTGKAVKESTHDSIIKSLGYADVPTKVEFYASNFDNKQKIKEYVAGFNKLSTTTDETKITITDMVSSIVSILETFINIITYILMALTAISLVVAAIMIAIITYISVIERTKEIGILRSIGARRVDVMSVFNAETVIIGLFSGVLGIILAIILQFPLSAVLYSLTGIGSLVVLSVWHAIALVIVSILVTLISGMIPAIMASKKDPVKALRSE